MALIVTDRNAGVILVVTVKALGETIVSLFPPLPGTSVAASAFLRMYLWWSLCTLYLHACQVRVTVGDSGLFTSGGVYVPCIYTNVR